MSNFNAPAGQGVDLTEIMAVGHEYEIEHVRLGTLRCKLIKKETQHIEVGGQGRHGPWHHRLSKSAITSVTRIKGA